MRAFSAGVVTALVFHVFLGWWLAALGAVIAGRLGSRNATILGSATLFVSWGLLIGYNFTVASAETAEMTRVTAALIGGLPAWVTIAATLVIAAVLGAIGGWLGGTLRPRKQR